MEHPSPTNADYWQMDFADLTAMVLRKEQFSMRPTAMRVLAERAQAEPGHLSRLADAFREADPSTRRRAAQTLGFAGMAAHSLLFELCELLRCDPIWTVREASARSIQSICWPTPHLQSSDEIPLRLVESTLVDREVLVRAACIQALDACLQDPNVVDSVKAAIWWGLEGGMQHEHASRRCRAVCALCALVDQNPAMLPQIAKGLRDSHWKVRRTAAQQLGEHPQLVLSVEGQRHLLAELIKRRFDLHRIVQAAARQTLDQLQAVASKDMQLIGERVQKCSTAREAIYELIHSPELTGEVEAKFLQLCQRRMDWHLREMPSPRTIAIEQSMTVDSALSCILELAGEWMISPKQLARNREAARTQAQEKETSWLLARLMEMLPSPEQPLGQ